MTSADSTAEGRGASRQLAGSISAPPIQSRPPEVITSRAPDLVHSVLVLSRLAPTDRDSLVEAVNNSFDELHRWMPWAETPADVASIAAFLERSRSAWAEGREFGYAIRKGDDIGLGLDPRTSAGGGAGQHGAHTEHRDRPARDRPRGDPLRRRQCGQPGRRRKARILLGADRPATADTPDTVANRFGDDLGPSSLTARAACPRSGARLRRPSTSSDPGSICPASPGDRLLQDEPVAVQIVEDNESTPRGLLDAVGDGDAPILENMRTSASRSSLSITVPLVDPGGMVGNQVTSVMDVAPPGGRTWTQRRPGPISASATSSNPSWPT